MGRATAKPRRASIEALARGRARRARARLAAPGDQRHRRRDSHQPRRAPLAEAAIERARRDRARLLATSNTTSPSGERGSRTVHAESLLTALTGAEAAVVVNNNAAATLLILAGARARAARWSSRAASWSRSAAASACPT